MTIGCTFKDIPEIFESESGNALQHRTDALVSYRELGPPDLCIVMKTQDVGKRTERTESSVHHVLGVDATTSASLAAYINSLTYSLDEQTGWFGKTVGGKIQAGTYCCYNAFGRTEVRVEIKIPGGVEAYVVTPQGDKREADAETWVETGVSGVLRAISYSEEQEYRLAGLRRVSLLENEKQENRFLEQVRKVFWKGWKLGSNSETQVATTANNYLVDCLVQYFRQSRRYGKLIEFLSEFAERDIEINSVIADLLVEGHKELDAVQLLHTSLEQRADSFMLLCSQARFLLAKNELDAALAVAQLAVRNAPSEFQPWSLLVYTHIQRQEYMKAILTLNSCPMFTYNEPEIPRLPLAKAVNFPQRLDASSGFDTEDSGPFSTHSKLVSYEHTPTPTPHVSSATSTPASSALNANGEKMSQAAELNTNEKSALLRLPATNLQGTFKRAYELLILIADKIGWDDLLRLRSSAFVMEEEYRNTLSRTSEASHKRGLDLGASVEVDNDNDNNTNTNVEVRAEMDAHAGLDSDVDVDKVVSMVQKASIDSRESHGSIPSIEQKESSFDEIPISDNEVEVEVEAEIISENDSKDMNGIDTENVNDTQNINQSDIEHEKEKEKENENEKENSVEEEKQAESEIEKKDVDVSEEVADQEEEKEEEDIEEINGEQQDEEKEVEGEIEKPKKKKKNKKKKAIPQVDGNDDDETSQLDIPDRNVSKYDKDRTGPKRLCERWLDNLFMILYEDLRVYTMWKAEMQHLKSTGQPITYRHTQAEWEALGDVSLRLLHLEDSKTAFLMSLEYRFSAHAWKSLLTLTLAPPSPFLNISTSVLPPPSSTPVHSSRVSSTLLSPSPATSLAHHDAIDLKSCLIATTWLACNCHRWYNDMVYPSFVCKTILQLVSKFGFSKVQNSIISLNLNQNVYLLMAKYLSYAKDFSTLGFNL